MLTAIGTIAFDSLTKQYVLIPEMLVLFCLSFKFV